MNGEQTTNGLRWHANPTGHATTAWAAALSRLRGAGVLECGCIVVELVDGEETIAKGEPAARWLSRDVLAVTNEVGHSYEALAPGLQAMLDRQDLLKDLLLVLGALEGVERPSREEIEKALERAQIDAQAFADIRSRWAGNSGLVASRIRPVAALLGVAGDGFEAATVDMDRLTDWLAANLPQWDAAALITAARRSRDDHAMGIAAWRALGNVAELTAWNAVLEGLGEEYEPVGNRDVQEQTNAHLDGMQALSAALARAVAVDCGEPELFRKIEDATHAVSATDDWSTRWWEVPFEAVVDALCDTWREIVDSEHLAVLRGTETPGQLRLAIGERGIAIEPDPYDTARGNGERFGRVLLEAHDLHRTWLEFRDPHSRVPDLPSAPELAADAYLCRWTDVELWRLALATLGDAGRRAVRPSVRRRFGPADGQGAAGPRRGGRRQETAGAGGAGKGSGAQGEDGGDRRRVLRNRSDRLLGAAPAAGGDAGGSSRSTGEQGRVHAARSASGQRQIRQRGEQGQNRASAPVPGGGRSGGHRRGDACLPVSAEGVWGTVGPCERMGLGVAVEGPAARGGREVRDQRRARIRLPVHPPRHPMARRGEGDKRR